MTYHLRRRGAFTMVEILMVIMIITVLMAIGIGAGWYMMTKAEAGQTKTTMETVMSALERYREVKEANMSGSGTEDFSMLFDTTTDEGAAAVVMLEKLPTDAVKNKPQILDGFGQNLRYYAEGGLGGTPQLRSAGPDGDWNTDDDIVSDK